MAGKATTAPKVEQTLVEQTANNAGQLSAQNIIKKLIADGAKRISSVRVKNVHESDQDNYTRISFSLANGIKGFVTRDEGASYEHGIVNVMYSSTYAIAGALKEDANLGWMANAIIDNPKAINLIFNGSTIDILQQEVKAGTEFVNPFTTKEDPEPQVYDHDIYINHLIGVKLGDTGQRMADRLADKLMGF